LCVPEPEGGDRVKHQIDAEHHRHRVQSRRDCYLALAAILGARLVAGDAALAAVPGTRCEVELVEA
jgi:hypothetical protein